MYNRQSFSIFNFQFSILNLSSFPVAHGIELLSGLEDHVGAGDAAGVDLVGGVGVGTAVVALADAVLVAGGEED